LLKRFYLNDQAKEHICQELRLSEEHFNRVIFRARNRFRELLERRGFWKGDLLTIVAVGLCVSGGASGIFPSAEYDTSAQESQTATAVQGGVP
jgi:hypothetical protein